MSALKGKRAMPLLVGTAETVNSVPAAPELPHIEDSLEYREHLKKLARVLRTTFYDARHYKANGECIKCWACSKEPASVRGTPVDWVENIVCEEEFSCAHCGTVLAHWAFGDFMPDYHIFYGDPDEGP